MGKQYNYFISPIEEQLFLEYLNKNGFLVLNSKKEIKSGDDVVWNWEVLQVQALLEEIEKRNTIPWRTYIYKEEWGRLKINQNKYTDFVSKNPVIEQCHCMINSDNKLSRGRFYIDTSYKEDIESFDVICREYQKLVCVMKKRLHIRVMILKMGGKRSGRFLREQ